MALPKVRPLKQNARARVLVTPEQARKARASLTHAINSGIIEQLNNARRKGDFKTAVSLYLEHWKGARSAELYLTSLILNGGRKFALKNKAKLAEAINLVKQKDISSASRINHALKQFL